MTGDKSMVKYVSLIVGLLFWALPAFPADDVVSAVDGTVKKVDAGAKTITIDTGKGAEETFHYVDHTSVHGVEAAGKGAAKSFHGVKEGDKVAVHYTAKGAEKTAHEVDRLGDDGLKATEGTVSHVDRGAKTVAIKTAEGSEEMFRLSDRAATDAGKDVADAAEKSAKVTVYYTGEAGHKVAHFIKKAF
jgi:hypothetical protein